MNIDFLASVHKEAMSVLEHHTFINESIQEIFGDQGSEVHPSEYTWTNSVLSESEESATTARAGEREWVNSISSGNKDRVQNHLRSTTAMQGQMGEVEPKVGDVVIFDSSVNRIIEIEGDMYMIHNKATNKDTIVKRDKMRSSRPVRSKKDGKMYAAWRVMK